MVFVLLEKVSGQTAGLESGLTSPLTIGILHLALYSLPAGSGLEDYSHVPRFVIVNWSWCSGVLECASRGSDSVPSIHAYAISGNGGAIMAISPIVT
jgi:hypothetical protein